MKFRQTNSIFLLLLSFVAASTTLLRTVEAVECDPDCDITSFCGDDGTCHSFTCENYYEFGIRDLINETTSFPPMECAPIESTILDLGRMTLSYRCVQVEPPAIVSGYNHKCEAATPNWNFSCYSIGDPTNTTTPNFDSFLGRIKNEPLECLDGESPFFTYASIYEWQRPGWSYTGFTERHKSTAEFNPEWAVTGTIYTYLDITPTPSPTLSPTPSPTTSLFPTMESSAAGRNLGWMLVAVAYSTFGSFLDLF